MITKDQITIYQTKDGNTSIQVKLENDSIWLNQHQLAELFKTDRTSLAKHIRYILRSGIRRNINLCKICASSNRRFKNYKKRGNSIQSGSYHFGWL